MTGNPYHDKKNGEFTSKSGGAGGAHSSQPHNAGGGNRAVAAHVAAQHKHTTIIGKVGHALWNFIKINPKSGKSLNRQLKRH